MDVYISLGTNLGDRIGHLLLGLESLERIGLGALEVSSLWSSEAVETADGQPFLNMVARGAGAAPPLEVLDRLLVVERRAGRIRGARNGPRTLDLDLLLMGDLQHSDARLQLPHPRMWQRRFVLAPLAEIAASRVNPSTGLTVEEELARLGDRPAVRRLGELVRV